MVVLELELVVVPVVVVVVPLVVVVVPLVVVVVAAVVVVVPPGAALNAAICINHAPRSPTAPPRCSCPPRSTERSSAMSPSGLVITRLVYPGPAAEKNDFVMPPPTRRSFVPVVVAVALVAVDDEPEADAATSNGAAGSSPLYSRTRTSG